MSEAPSAEERLRRLRGLALLGRSRDRALALAGELAVELPSEVTLDLSAQRASDALLAWAAELSLHRGEASAARQLALAARQAEQHGAAVEALRLRLLGVRATAASGLHERAQDLLLPLVIEAEAHPGLAADLALARVAAAPSPSREHLEDALARLPSPARDHDRLTAHLVLAELLTAGADRVRARVELEAAVELSRRHDDGVAQIRCLTLLGAHLMEIGLADEAEPPLRAAFTLAVARNDDLSTVLLGSLLAALYQARGAWAEADAVARPARGAAERRHNWIGVADASLTLAGTSAWIGDRPAAVTLLLEVGGQLAERGAEAALNLIKARLAELRGEWGEVEFALAAGIEPPAPEEDDADDADDEDAPEPAAS